MPVVPCTVTPIVQGIVQFDPNIFVVLYPEFNGFLVPGVPPTSPVLSQSFAIATLLLNNTCGSRVCDANQRETLLNLLVAHITFLSAGTSDGDGNIVPPPGIVGRINTATEGAVSVGAEFNAPPNANQAYFIQSKYGALYWTATAKYRTFLVIPAPYDPCDNIGPWAIGLGGPGCGC